MRARDKSIGRLHNYLELLVRYPSELDAFLRDCFNKLWTVLRFFAHYYRNWIIPNKHLVVLVGSLGKTTTTRELRAALLETDHYQSFSNYGVRLAENILRSRPNEPYYVFEVGISGPGQMEQLSRLIRPNIVVVTSITSDHNRSFPTLEDTRREKVKMIQGLTSEGMAILNGDDPNVKWMASHTKARVKTIGMDPTNDVWASEVELNWPR